MMYDIHLYFDMTTLVLETTYVRNVLLIYNLLKLAGYNYKVH